MRRRSVRPASVRLARHGWVLLLGLAGLLGGPVAPATEPSDVGARLRAVVAQYEQLVTELNLNRLPGHLFNYPAVTEQLDRLGARLEPLSRAVLRADQLAPAELSRLREEVAALGSDVAILRRQSLALRVWGYYHEREDVRRPHWGLATAPAGVVVSGERDDCEASAGGEVSLAAARGGTATAQLVVVPLDRDLRDVRGVVAALRGPGGTIPAAALSCQPLGADGTPGVLLPPGSVEVAEGRVQALWLTVTVPRDQKPGQYRGIVRVRAAGQETLEAAVELTVWNFTLPATPGLALSAGLDVTPEQTALRQQAADLLAQYRCRLDVVGPAAGALTVPATDEDARLWGRRAWAEQAAGLWAGIANAPDLTRPLLYRGPDGQPLASQRLTRLRQGSEDYDLLRSLDALAANHPEAAALRGEALAMARQESEDGAWEELRRRVGEALDRAETPKPAP
jgi:hypothetical protein